MSVILPPSKISLSLHTKPIIYSRDARNSPRDQAPAPRRNAEENRFITKDDNVRVVLAPTREAEGTRGSALDVWLAISRNS